MTEAERKLILDVTERFFERFDRLIAVLEHLNALIEEEIELSKEEDES
jgi:hypothetical protein